MDINKKINIKKALFGIVLKLSKSLKLAANVTRRFITGEMAAERKLNNVAKKKILLLKASWRPTLKMRDKNLEEKKQIIRDARAMRSAASKAELEWMQANPDKATKIYKSGTREFGGEANKAALLKVRLEAMQPFISAEAKNIRKKIGKKALKVGLLVGLPYYYFTNNNTGPTASIIDLIGNNTRKDDGTPRFTHTYTYNDFNSDQQAFLQDAIDKKQTLYWSNPEGRTAYFEKHPNDTIRTGWNGRIAGTNIKLSDYKKYYGKDYVGLSDMPKLTGFGIGIGMKDPVEAGMYETMLTLGSFPIAYTKDHAIIDDTWDFSKADRDKQYVEIHNPSDILRNLRIFVGKHGTNEADNYPPVVKTHAKVPYKKINKDKDK